MTPKHAQHLLDSKTKPPGSLGRLESAAQRMAVLKASAFPEIDPVHAVLFAADHGVADEGVSAYPQAVTAQMVRTCLDGGAASTVLARSVNARLTVVDVGVKTDLGALASTSHVRFVHAPVRPGTRNLRRESALTPDEVERALETGRGAVARACDDGAEGLVLGEMGIANTTTAAALLSALTGAPPDVTTGRGTGVDAEGLGRKRQVVADALHRHRMADASTKTDVRDVLASLGGLEITALVGAIRDAADRHLPVLVDGFIVTVAALLAVRMAGDDENVSRSLFFAHRGSEQGHRIALDACADAGCDAEPLLDLNLRLGEASGALLAVPLLRSACALFHMASFDDANVSGPN